MSRFALFLLSLIIAFKVWAQDPSPNDLFQNGLAAYQNKRYDEARGHFEKLLSLRPADAHVMHNLALTYFQLEQRPLAMAYWRKALTAAPDYKPARISKEYLEQRMNMRPFERDPVKLWLRENLAGLSVIEASWFVALLLAASGFFWIRYTSERVTAVEEERAMPHFPVAALLLSGTLVLALITTGLKIKQLSLTRATVIEAKVSVRSLPSEGGVSVFDLNGGSEVVIRRRDNGWAQVLSSDGNSGWLKQSEILVTSGG